MCTGLLLPGADALGSSGEDFTGATGDFVLIMFVIAPITVSMSMMIMMIEINILQVATKKSTDMSADCSGFRYVQRQCKPS